MNATITAMINKFSVYFRYIISGGSAALTNVALLFLFTDIFHIYYLLSATLSYLISFFVSFYLQKYWTFGDGNRDKLYGQMSLYFIVAMANLLVNDILMYIFVDWLGIHHLISQILTSGLIAVYSFILYKILVFKQKEIISDHG